MNLSTIFLVVSIAFNIYLVLRVVRVQGRARLMSRTFQVLARQGKIDGGDIGEASRQARADVEIDRDVRRTIYGGKQ